MMYNVKHMSGIWNPVRIFDANENQIKYVLECDTETGRVVQQLRDEEGRPKLSPCRTKIETIVKYYPTPLRVESIDC